MWQGVVLYQRVDLFKMTPVNVVLVIGLKWALHNVLDRHSATFSSPASYENEEEERTERHPRRDGDAQPTTSFIAHFISPRSDANAPLSICQELNWFRAKPDAEVNKKYLKSTQECWEVWRRKSFFFVCGPRTGIRWQVVAFGGNERLFHKIRSKGFLQDGCTAVGSRKNKSAPVERHKYVQCVCLSCGLLFGLEMRQFVWVHSVRWCPADGCLPNTCTHAPYQQRTIN